MPFHTELCDISDGSQIIISIFVQWHMVTENIMNLFSFFLLKVRGWWLCCNSVTKLFSGCGWNKVMYNHWRKTSQCQSFIPCLFCVCTHTYALSTSSVPVKLCPLHSQYNGIQEHHHMVCWVVTTCQLVWSYIYEMCLSWNILHSFI